MKTKALFFVILTVSLFTPSLLSAAVLPVFGGFDVAMIPCTCTPGLFWHYFTPLYLNSPLSLSGPLTAPAAVSFSYYALHPASWALGTFVTGAQACYIGVEPYCYLMPSYGFISPMTGVSPTI